MASHRPFLSPRIVVLLILAIFALACWVEPCDDSSGHSCTNAERSLP